MSTIPTLTTHRLVLRPFCEDDAPAVARILSTPRTVGRPPGDQHPYPVDAARNWVRQHNDWAERGLHLQWGITLPDDMLVGMVSLDLGKDPPQGDLGYLLDAAYWNQGYATEAVQAVIAYGLDVLHLPRIQATCYASNLAFARVLEKCGLTLEALLPGSVIDNGRRHDVKRFAISRQPAREAR